MTEETKTAEVKTIANRAKGLKAGKGDVGERALSQ